MGESVGTIAAYNLIEFPLSTQKNRGRDRVVRVSLEREADIGEKYTKFSKENKPASKPEMTSVSPANNVVSFEWAKTAIKDLKAIVRGLPRTKTASMTPKFLNAVDEAVTKKFGVAASNLPVVEERTVAPIEETKSFEKLPEVFTEKPRIIDISLNENLQASEGFKQETKAPYVNDDIPAVNIPEVHINYDQNGILKQDFSSKQVDIQPIQEISPVEPIVAEQPIEETNTIDFSNLDDDTIARGLQDLISENQLLKKENTSLKNNIESMSTKVDDQIKISNELQLKLKQAAVGQNDAISSLNQVTSERDQALLKIEKMEKMYDDKVAQLNSSHAAEIEMWKGKLDASEARRVTDVEQVKTEESAKVVSIEELYRKRYGAFKNVLGSELANAGKLKIDQETPMPEVLKSQRAA